MTRRTALLAAFALALGVGTAWAHDGHAHSVMGTVSLRHESHLEVTTADGKKVAITVNDATKVVRGKEKLTLDALAVGQRVVVDVGNGKTPLIARQVKLGAAPKSVAAGSSKK